MDVRRILVPVLFLAGVGAVVLGLDANLAARVAAALEDTRSALAEASAGAAAGPSATEGSSHRISGVAADLCSALTGTIQGAWMLPRTRRIMRENPFEVRVEGGRCRRGSSRHVLHLSAP